MHIYSKYLRKKLLYYLHNYHYIVTKISINEINDLDINRSIPLALSDIDPLESYNTLRNFPSTNINNTNYIPKANSSIAYSFISENNINYGNHTERINKKNFFDNKNKRKRRTLSYGNLAINMKKDNEDFKDFDNMKLNNSNNFNNSSIINNNTQSLKHIFPSYTYTTPNKYIYPIILNNNNNNCMNNSLLYQYPGNTIVYQNDVKSEQSKPLLWYTNVFPSISQISIMQDNNNYLNGFQTQTPKYINNSAFFNSITNINNSYSEDYLNKQIFDFINANSKTKQNIISNIGKKHNIKLSKSKKLNDKNIKIKEKSEKNKRDKNIGKNRNENILYKNMKNKNYSEFHEINDKNFANNNLVINKYKRNEKLKINKGNNLNKGKKKIPIDHNKRNIINNLKKTENIYLDKNKIIKNYSIEISNSGQLINNNDYLYENNTSINPSINKKNNHENSKENKYSFQITNNKDNIFNIYNSEDKEEDEQNNSFNENLVTSLQTINDSKMFELANQFIEEDKIVNKEKINEILNEKNTQRNIKLSKDFII